MAQSAENLRYLLWREGLDRSEWVRQISSWANCTAARAEELLRDGELSAREQKQIADVTGHTEDELQYSRLVQVLPKRDSKLPDILLENLSFLISGLKHGSEKRFAQRVGVSAITVSRWAYGKQRPPRGKLPAICSYFGFPAATDLEGDPLFLALSPVGETARKNWLHEQVDRLNSNRLNELFPALETLLKD